jgi:hypothetical protein
MHRQIIAVTPAQQRWLVAQAKKAGTSITEIFRRLLDREMTAKRKGA